MLLLYGSNVVRWKRVRDPPSRDSPPPAPCSLRCPTFGFGACAQLFPSARRNNHNAIPPCRKFLKTCAKQSGLDTLSREELHYRSPGCPRSGSTLRLRESLFLAESLR